ncbi:Kelch motif protein [Phycisphaerae bacterium RAS1]|nr:Kelch motif protein [Phycisphaerae bacterium RAS1]
MAHKLTRLFWLLPVLVSPLPAQPPLDAIPAGPAISLGIIRGTVAVGASPVSNARVMVFVPSLAYFREARTNAIGRYAIKGVPSGAYRLGVAARDFDYQEIAIEISGGILQREFTLAPETEPGRWDVIGNTAGEFFDASDIGILLADGRIMYCHDTITPVIFDPATGQSFVAAGSDLPQGCMNIMLLPDGRPIFVGGQPGSDPGQFRNAVRYVKAYNPVADTWERFADLLNPTGRWYPGMARLADGSLLAMGGGTRPNAVRTATCERLNLATMTWSWTGSMINPSEFSPCALLYTGEVLATWNPPQLYNPTTGEWRLTGAFNQPVRGWPDHSDHSLIVLADGRAAAIGIDRANGGAYTVMSEIYDPATESWSLGSSPALLREKSEVVPLPDGRVLVAAGDTELANPGVPHVNGVVKWTDLYEPATGVWRRMADMGQFREYHAVTLLVPDGRVLTTGGTVIDFGNPPNSADVEAFSPPYLFRGVRPQIANLSDAVVDRGSNLTLTIVPAIRLTSAVLVGTQATTHWVDAGIPRRVVLSVQQSGANASVTLPTDPNVLPLGHYMLFAMVDDSPSVARMIEVR